MSQLDFKLYSSPFDSAWEQELFYSKYPPNSTYDWVDTDTPENAIDSRTITYDFNEYGFRSDSFDKRSDFNILVSGCSLTVGIGVAYQYTWPQVLKTHINQPTTVWNLAQSAMSPDYVVRSIYKTIDILKPDLVVVCWPCETRLELPFKRSFVKTHFFEEKTYPRELQVPGWDEHNHRKNIILLKEICQSRNIPCVSGPGPLTDIGIDPRTGARDGTHPDEKWHKEYAELVFQHYQDKY
jgi:hypothetical protein